MPVSHERFLGKYTSLIRPIILSYSHSLISKNLDFVGIVYYLIKNKSSLEIMFSVPPESDRHFIDAPSYKREGNLINLRDINKERMFFVLSFSLSFSFISCSQYLFLMAETLQRKSSKVWGALFSAIRITNFLDKDNIRIKINEISYSCTLGLFLLLYIFLMSYLWSALST